MTIPDNLHNPLYLLHRVREFYVHGNHKPDWTYKPGHIRSYFQILIVEARSNFRREVGGKEVYSTASFKGNC